MRTDARMVPVAAAVWAASWVATSTEPTWCRAVMIGALVVAGLGWWLRRVTVLVIAGLVLLLVPLGVARDRSVHDGPVAHLARERAVASAELELTSDLRSVARAREPTRIGRARLLLLESRGRRITTHAPVLVVLSGDDPAPPVGARVRLNGRLEAPQPGDPVAAVIRIRSPGRVVERPPPLLRAVESVRAGLRDVVPEGRAGALVPALVLGDTSLVDSQDDAAFRTSGLTHLTAVSGANLAILIAFVAGVARAGGLRGRGVRIVSLVCVAVFVALCRSEPSVLRAAAMGVVTVAALGGGARGVRALRHLAVAVTVLMLIDPWLSRSWGMVLSVLACAGIVVWASGWATRLDTWLPRSLAEAMAVPMAAQVLTTPVVAVLSGQVSLVSLPANMAAGPFVGPVTVLGFAAAGLAIGWPGGAHLVAVVASWGTQCIIWIAQASAALPGAARSWPPGPVAIAVLLGASVLLAFIMPRLVGRPWVMLAVLGALVLALLRAPAQPGWPPRTWSMVSCDVGQGDATVLRAGPGQAVLVDAGPDPTAVQRCLSMLGVRRLPLIVLTHFHADHVAGLAAAVRGRAVGLVLISPLASPPREAAVAAQTIRAAGGTMRVAQPGERIVVGEVAMTVLAPASVARAVTDAGNPESSAENNASVVTVAQVGGLRILLPGDAEPEEQQPLVGPALEVDVLKLPHHGSAHQDPAFIAATHARIAVASAGLRNDYGHPAPRTLALVQQLGMRIVRTDQQGSLAFARDGPEIVILTQRSCVRAGCG